MKSSTILTGALFITTALFLFSMQGCDRASPESCAACAAAIPVNGWCDRCAVGYVAGAPIKSRMLYDMMDAHGHPLQGETMACADCRRYSADRGFCKACRLGWCGGQAYFSRLTFEIACATMTDAQSLTCAACRLNSQSAGWCEACKRGLIGPFAFADRADYDAACGEFDRMRSAIETSKRCDYCAVAMVTDSFCFACKKTYKDGVEVDDASAQSGNGD